MIKTYGGLVLVFLVISIVYTQYEYRRAEGNQRFIEQSKEDMIISGRIGIVERVVDGDTLKLTNGVRVRLIGIDTPENKSNDKAKRDSERTGKDLETITKMGQEATEFVHDLGLEGKEVRLEFDVQERDKYGRLLAYVFLKVCPDDGLCKYEAAALAEYKTLNGLPYNFINATIIKAGYASPMTIPPNVKYVDLFRKLYEQARENKRGLWR